MNDIKVLVVDDHQLFRVGMVEFLKDQRRIRVVGEADGEEEALRCISDTLPDIVLMDIDFGPTREMEGLSATKRITETYADLVKVIMLTMHDNEDIIFDAIESGARGYVLKDADQETLLQTIISVEQGGVILSPTQAEKILKKYRYSMRSELDQELSALTEREKEILKLVATGASNEEIASSLSIAEKTVRNRLSTIFSKLHVNNRTQAAQYATKLGLD